MSTTWLHRLLLMIGGLLLVIPPRSAADTFFIYVNASGFSPDSQTIARYDTVTWVNDDDTDDFHTTTSTLPFINFNYWEGILSFYLDTFSQKFNNAGTYTYYDRYGIGTGTIIVNAAAAPILLESPRVVGGQFEFDVTGLTTGRTNVLQFSTSLTSWTALQTNVASGSSNTLSVAVQPGARFYQLFQLP